MPVAADIGGKPALVRRLKTGRSNAGWKPALERR